MRIVVGVDGSSQALAGARWVAQLPLVDADEVTLAAIAKCPVLLGGWGRVTAPGAGDLCEMAWDGVRLAARRAADGAAHELGDAHCAVRTIVQDGHPVDALVRLAEADAADLIVIGPHGKSRLDRFLLGSVSQGLVQALPTSVVIVREPAPSPTRVLLATDGSPHSLSAARYLARFPLPPTAGVHVVVVIEECLGPSASEESARAAEVMDATLGVLADGGITASPTIRRGDARREILAALDESRTDLLVVGARGLGGFEGLVLGSVSRVLTRAAPCSVLVVPGRRITAQ